MNLVLKGKAGQGVQLMSFVLANILKDNGFNVSLIGEYGPLMRAGESVAKLVFSKDKIGNPIFENADEEYDLGSDEYEKIKVLNMFLVGVILKKLKIKFDIGQIKKYLPEKNFKENLEAVEEGYRG